MNEAQQTYFQQMTAKLPDGNYTLLRILDQQIWLISGSKGKAASYIKEINWGLTNAPEILFSKELPPYEEFDHAIEKTEDILMSFHRELPTDTVLVSSDAALWRIANVIKPTDNTETELDQTQLEILFGRYAAILTGRPASMDTIPVDNQFGFCMLFLREVLHHLKFGRIKLIE